MTGRPASPISWTFALRHGECDSFPVSQPTPLKVFDARRGN
jgi:hypothetical protein